MRTSSLITASLATAAIAFGAILGSGPAQAGKGCCTTPDKTRGGTKICKIEVGGPNHQQKDWCESCGFTYVNTGKLSTEGNYCVMP